ncbi:MAG: FecR family protein [bacterium]|nr:FecR family protein [bacterium]
MKKNIWKYILSILLIYSCWPISHALALPEPQKVHATSQVVTIFGADIIYFIDFWNVGKLGNSNKYSQIKITAKCADDGDDEFCGKLATKESIGTFSGGPDGTFKVDDVVFKLIDGKKTTAYDNGYTAIFTIDNPEVFKGSWSGKDTKNDIDDEQNEQDEESDTSKKQDIPTDKKDTANTNTNTATIKTTNTTKGDDAEQADEQIPHGPDFTIEKAIGDVQYSDPAKEASLVTMSARAIASLITIGYKDVPYGGVRREWEQPKAETTMKDNAIIRTESGRAVLKFKDGTKFILKQDSVLSITPNGIRIEKGAGYYIFPKSNNRTEVKIEYGRHHIGITGTEFSLVITDDAMAVNLVEGSLALSSDDNGETLQLEAGKSVVLSEAGISEPVAFDEEAEQADWQETEAQTPAEITSDISEPIIVPAIILITLLLLIGGITFMIIKKRKK